MMGVAAPQGAAAHRARSAHPDADFRHENMVPTLRPARARTAPNQYKIDSKEFGLCARLLVAAFRPELK
jgi:hypothetical protein